MYQYRGYTIQLSSSGDYLVRDLSGKIIVRCVSDNEAQEYIDDMLESDDANPSVEISDEYCVCRINKFDDDNLNNYQYYDGRYFRFGTSNIKYLSKQRCESVVRYFQHRKDEYLYRIIKK